MPEKDEQSRIKKINPINEMQLLKSLEHENIIKYNQSFIENNKLIIIMEYAEEGLMLILKDFRNNFL